MLTPGTVLQNRYRILRLLGTGGMGAVYQAQAMNLGITVAVKENLGSDPHQFQQEANILAGLRHANLPRVTDHFVEPNGAQYLVMDYIEGEDLREILSRRGATPEAQVLAWFNQILDAVAYLHHQGIIHRDIKPGNIKITPTGQAVLVDFGIAKLLESGQLTLTGAKLASPGFAAPEQYSRGTDARTDIYALGATLYAALCGGPPPDALALECGTARLTPPRALVPALSVPTERAILHAMELQPNLRFSSVDELRRALAGIWVSQTEVARAPTPIQTEAATAPAPTPAVPAIVRVASPRARLVSRLRSSPVLLSICAIIALALLLVIASLIVRSPSVGVSGSEITATPVAGSYISSKWREGYEITGLAYGDGQWLALLARGTPLMNQGYFPDARFPAGTVQTRWREGYEITNLAYGNGQWVAVMSQVSPYRNQLYLPGSTFPAEAIQTRWREGYQITSLAYGEGGWVAVMSQVSPYQNQLYLPGSTFPAEVIQSRWREGYEITDLAFGEGQWVAVMSQDSPYQNQLYLSGVTFPATQVQDRWAEGYDITSIAYGQGQWIVVMSLDSPYTDQIYSGGVGLP